MMFYLFVFVVQSLFASLL